MNTDLWTPRECAGYRRCSLRTLDRERERGDGCSYVRIGGRIYYRRNDVDEFIAAHVCGGDRVRPVIATESAPPRRVPKKPSDVTRHLDELTRGSSLKATP
jgi:hypothetical protein